MHECNETRCYGWQGKKMQNKEKWNACKGILIDQGGVENLSKRSQPRWIENLSRMCRVDREHKILAQWIDLSVEKLSRSNPEISIKEVSVKILSRSYWGCRKEVFRGGKTHKMRKQQDGYKQASKQHVKHSNHTSTLDEKHS